MFSISGGGKGRRWIKIPFYRGGSTVSLPPTEVGSTVAVEKYRPRRGNPWPATSWRAKRAREDPSLRFKAAVVAKCGDWAWHRQMLGVPGWQHDQPCWRCSACISDRDFSCTAAWRGKPRDMRWLLDASLQGNQFVSAIFMCPGFDLSYIVPDWMHCCCLGICQVLLGNVLWECFKQVGGSMLNWRPAVGRLMHLIRTVSNDLGLEMPVRYLTITMIRRGYGKKPCMRLKATETRRLLPVVTVMLSRFSPQETKKKRSGCTAVKPFAGRTLSYGVGIRHPLPNWNYIVDNTCFCTCSEATWSVKALHSGMCSRNTTCLLTAVLQIPTLRRCGTILTRMR